MISKSIVNHVLTAGLLAASSTLAFAADDPAPLPSQTLFTNVNIFNGTENKLYEGMNVLVEGNLIKSIGTKKPAIHIKQA